MAHLHKTWDMSYTKFTTSNLFTDSIPAANSNIWDRLFRQACSRAQLSAACTYTGLLPWPFYRHKKQLESKQSQHRKQPATGQAELPEALRG